MTELVAGGSTSPAPVKVAEAPLPAAVTIGADYETSAEQFTTPKAYALRKLRIEKALVEEGRSAVKLKALLSAQNFIELLSDIGMPIPRVMFASDGEVALYARKEKIYIDIGFAPDGTYSYFVRDINGLEFMGDDLYPAYGLPKPLQQVFINIAAV